VTGTQNRHGTTTFTGVQQFTTGAGNDTFTFAAIDNTSYTINGGAGIDTLDLSKVIAALTIIINGANSSSSSSSANHGTSSFQNIEKIIGGSGVDKITIDGSDLSVYTIEARGGDDIVTGNGKSILSYDQNTTGISLHVDKGAGNSSSAGAGNDSFSNFTQFDGGLGSDKFTLTNKDKTEYTINGGGGQDTFLISNQNKATITGGSSLTDNDILSFTNNTSKVTINIINGAGTAIDADSGEINFSNIRTFIGGSGGSEFKVSSTDVNSYTLQGGAGTDKLTGGAGNDTLVINASGLSSGTFDGGTGTDTLKILATDGAIIDLIGIKNDSFKSIENIDLTSPEATTLKLNLSAIQSLVDNTSGTPTLSVTLGTNDTIEFVASAGQTTLRTSNEITIFSNSGTTLTELANINLNYA
jgi:hypothetical protein